MYLQRNLTVFETLFLLAMTYSLALSMLVSIVGALAVLASDQRLSCYHSTEQYALRNYRGNYYSMVRPGTVPVRHCSTGQACVTEVHFRNGELAYIRRACSPRHKIRFHPSEEHVANGGCQSHHYPNDVRGSTRCIYYCSNNTCNNQYPDSFRKCLQECSGNCDFFTGQCHNSGQRCVQCHSKENENCESKTEATLCPRYASHCFIHEFARFGHDLNVEWKGVIKGCASIKRSQIPSQRCHFDIKDDSGQPKSVYFCTEFCIKNGCNKAIRKVTKNALQCVVCSEFVSTDNCEKKSQTTVCPSKSTHCKSTVTYYVSQDQVSQHKIASIKRECSSERVKPSCTTKTLDEAGLNVVTCVETCATSGCNTGWPGRPKCSRCMSSTATGSERCRVSPPPPSQCQSPLHDYCFTKVMNIENVPGFSATVSRGCSISDIGTSCTDERFGDTTIRNCQTSCHSSGCNQGLLPHTAA